MHRPSIRIRRRPTRLARLRRLVPSGTRLQHAGSTVVTSVKAATDRLPDLPGRTPKPRFSRKTKGLVFFGLTAAGLVGYVLSRRQSNSLPWADDSRPSDDKPSAKDAAATTLAEARDEDDALRATVVPGAAAAENTDVATTEGDGKS